nr:MAG TPA: hypothetical protein [Caudoviricetes sp.]
MHSITSCLDFLNSVYHNKITLSIPFFSFSELVLKKT